MAHLGVFMAFWRVFMALLRVSTALSRVFMALLRVSMALFRVFMALSRVTHVPMIHATHSSSQKSIVFVALLGVFMALL